MSLAFHLKWLAFGAVTSVVMTGTAIFIAVTLGTYLPM